MRITEYTEDKVGYRLRRKSNCFSEELVQLDFSFGGVIRGREKRDVGSMQKRGSWFRSLLEY